MTIAWSCHLKALKHFQKARGFWCLAVFEGPRLVSLRCCHCPICGFVPSGWDRLCGLILTFGLLSCVGYFGTWGTLGPGLCWATWDRLWGTLGPPAWATYFVGYLGPPALGSLAWAVSGCQWVEGHLSVPSQERWGGGGLQEGCVAIRLLVLFF